MPDLLQKPGRSPEIDKTVYIQKHLNFFSVFTTGKYYSKLKRHFSTSSSQIHAPAWMKRVFVVCLKIKLH